MTRALYCRAYLRQSANWIARDLSVTAVFLLLVLFLRIIDRETQMTRFFQFIRLTALATALTSTSVFAQSMPDPNNPAATPGGAPGNPDARGTGGNSAGTPSGTGAGDMN